MIFYQSGRVVIYLIIHNRKKLKVVVPNISQDTKL